jgi:hypothetical protein
VICPAAEIRHWNQLMIGIWTLNNILIKLKQENRTHRVVERVVIFVCI